MFQKRPLFLSFLMPVLVIALFLSGIFVEGAYADGDHQLRPTPAPGTIEAVKAFVGNKVAISYQGRGNSPYSPATAIDVFYVGTDQYDVSIAPVRVIQFGPRALLATEQPRDYDTTDRYTPDELEAMAISFISKHAPNVDLNTLVPAHGNKEEINYFFRWEDTSSTDTAGILPFIQVGFSRGGDLLSFTNTIGLVGAANVKGDATSDTGASPSIVTSTEYYYANDGAYYTAYGPSQYWYPVSKMGFCGSPAATWCGPYKMEYTWAGNTLSNWARWNNTDIAQNASLAAFIPRLYATSTRAPYYVRANGSNFGPYLVNQFNYYDAFAPIVQLYNIQYVEIHDDTGETNKQIGVDEIRLIYP